MNRYIVQIAYTPEACQAMIKNPHDRREVLQPLFERVGGRYEHLWFTPANGRAVGVVLFPDETTASAVATAVRASGAFESLELWPALTSAEAVDLFKTTGSIAYQPPG